MSAVDSHVGKTIWNEAILNYLKAKGTTVLIASHQTQYFSDCDRVMSLNNGQIEYFDTPENVLKKGAKILGLTSESSSKRETSGTGLASVPGVGVATDTTTLSGDINTAVAEAPGGAAT